MNPHTAPHHLKSVPPSVNGNDLAPLFESLRANAATPSTSVNSLNSQNHSLIRFNLDANGHDFDERARNEFHDNNQIIMNSRLLQLSDQVNRLMAQRSVFEKKQAESDRTIQELREQVNSLKTQVNTHHNRLEAVNQLLSDRSRETHQADVRVSNVQKSVQQQMQQQAARIDHVEALARQTETQSKVHASQLREDDVRLGEIEDKVNGVKTQNKSAATRPSELTALHKNPDLIKDMRDMRKDQGILKNYIKQIGETLLEHKNSLTTYTVATDGLRVKVETMGAIIAQASGQQEYAIESSIFKMEPSAAALLQLQTQINRLESELQRKPSVEAGNSASRQLDGDAPGSLEMDKILAKMHEMEDELATHSRKHKHMDEIALATKYRLEELFFKLSKEMRGLCSAEEVEFGVGEEQAFILRQRVLERLAVDNTVQVEFEQLNERLTAMLP